MSEEVGEAVKQFGVDPSRVMVTQCTADLRYFDRGRRDDTRAALGLGDAFVIGWVGTFRPFHALDLLLDSFEAVASAEPQCHLLLVGDGPMATHVRERVRAAGLENRVTFTGSVIHTQVGAYVAAFDVAVLQAQSAETFHYSPMKMREYMAAGVPVVGVDAGDVRRTITRSGAGWLVPAGDAADVNGVGAGYVGYDVRRQQVAEVRHFAVPVHRERAWRQPRHDSPGQSAGCARLRSACSDDDLVARGGGPVPDLDRRAPHHSGEATRDHAKPAGHAADRLPSTRP